jgi:hypothetical protein
MSDSNDGWIITAYRFFQGLTAGIGATVGIPIIGDYFFGTWGFFSGVVIGFYVLWWILRNLRVVNS